MSALELMRVLLEKDARRFLVWFLREGLQEFLRRLSANKAPVQIEEEEKSLSTKGSGPFTNSGIMEFGFLM